VARICGQILAEQMNIFNVNLLWLLCLFSSLTAQLSTQDGTLLFVDASYDGNVLSVSIQYNWTWVEDHRGESGYLNGEPFDIKELGVVSRNFRTF
jgi:hypothetical protein